MRTASIELFILFLAICISVAYGRPPRKILDDEDVWNIPYQVAIHDTLFSHHCGGAIIDTRHILTSAHCVVNRSGNALLSNLSKIIVGTNDLWNVTWDNLYNIANITVHESYNATDSLHNDIAVVKLDRDIQFTRSQIPIRLPVNDTTEGTLVTVTGWGTIYYNASTNSVGRYPRYLQEFSQKVISQQQCQEMMSDEFIHPDQICAWSGGRSIVCYGDSGSPLVDSNSIVGIALFNQYCNSSYPTVYTRVYKYVQWIKNITRTL